MPRALGRKDGRKKEVVGAGDGGESGGGCMLALLSLLSSAVEIISSWEVNKGKGGHCRIGMRVVFCYKSKESGKVG